MSSDSGSSNHNGEGIRFSKATRYYKFGVSSDSAPEEVKNGSMNDNNFNFGYLLLKNFVCFFISVI